ncbi:lipoprotein [Streptomyces fulvoviolaceus]|uniref:lipoprotein n=1 Tax=Streptomyces fulvoviolaceus TaxID=285535 RepID=UPI0004C8636E|nr:lipoprotein [Streptomyces fulvoviolaceus]
MARKALVCAAASAALLLSPGLATAGDADGLSARELVEQAQDNLLDAESVHLKLTDRSADASTSTTQPTSMDLSLDQDGNCVGSMEMGSDGGSVEIVKQGDEVWMKPDTAFWKAQVPGGEGDAVAELFKNRYIHGSTRDAMLKGMADTCDLTSFQQEVDTDSSDAGKLRKGDETTVDGTKVVPLKGVSDGKQAVLYVTSDSPHRLVQATQKGDGTDMTLSFSDYGKPVPSKTPSADETVDVGKLQDELQSV